MDVLEHIQLLKDTPLHGRILRSINLLRRTFVLYPKQQIAFSFNGGKDSTVLLHLLRAAVAMDLIESNAQQDTQPHAQSPVQPAQQGNHCSIPSSTQPQQAQAAAPSPTMSTTQPGSTTGPGSLSADGELGGVRNFFFVHDADFTEVKQFVRDCDARYSLHVDYLTDPDFKHGLESYLALTAVKAVVLGTRRGDPNAGDQEHFCPSSQGWPAFMRVNPILDWTYHEVWVFLRAIKVEYCCLYDLGYTSLGSIHNTQRNSSLLQSDGSYCAAHLLEHGHLERAGRPSKSSTQKLPTHTAEAPQTTVVAAAASSDLGSHLIAVIAVVAEAAVGEESASAAAAATPVDVSCGKVATVSAGASQRRHTAALVVIGDEILSGKVQDSNSGFLCSELRAIGWSVGRIVTVLDDVDAIAAEVRNCSSSYELVITSGGVGPTLDDVTMEGVAAAMGQKLVRNAGMERTLSDYFGERLTASHLKMAQTPETCELLDYLLEGGAVAKFPMLRCKNVYVLPGVPHLLREKWYAIKTLLTCAEEVPLPRFRNKVLRLILSDEALIAPALTELSTRHPGVQLGSYPVSSEADHATLLITLDSKSATDLQLALEFLTLHLPEGCTMLGEETDVRVLLSPRV